MSVHPVAKDNKNFPRRNHAIMSQRTKSPLRAANLRLPGESLHKQEFDELMDNAMLPMMLAVVVVIYAGLEWWRYFTSPPPTPWFISICALLVCTWAVWKTWRTIRRVRAIRQGRAGERWVAQYLEALRARDFHVYHDIPTGDANIDHVLVGPQGIFTVETKTLSKPERGAVKIVVDAEGIRANGHLLDRNPITQALAQAGWLKAFYGDGGFKVMPQPLVAFPGWYVEQTYERNAIGCWVLEPKMIDAEIARLPVRYSPAEVRAMALALSSYVRAQADAHK